MLLEPQETPYALRFRLFGIPVRVHPMFWLFTVILGWNGIKFGFEFVLLWVACVFVSILIHEFGHVFMGMAFGTRSYVVLYSFGGLAVGSNRLHHWWQRVLVSLAGPLAGFAFMAVVIFGTYLAAPQQFEAYILTLRLIFGVLDPQSLNQIQYEQLYQILMHRKIQDALFLDLFFINLFWGLMNLLPIWPLDGGQVSRDVLSRVSRDNGLKLSLGVSFIVAALLAINAVVGMNNKDRGLIPYIPAGGIFVAMMFGLLAVQSFMLLQQVSSPSHYDPHDPWGGQGRPWER